MLRTRSTILSCIRKDYGSFGSWNGVFLGIGNYLMLAFFGLFCHFGAVLTKF